MKHNIGYLAAGLLLGRAAATTGVCLPANSDICFQFSVPRTTADSGSGNFNFQMRAPTSLAWMALGTGTGMAGASIFVLYADGSDNVTVSPRLGTGYIEPQYTTDGARLELMAGSGVADGVMVANVRCTNCTLDYSGTNNFISAWKSGSMASASPSAQITVHDDYTGFQLNLADAVTDVDANANPFVSSNGNDTGVVIPDQGSFNSTTGISISGSSEGLAIAHGVIMAAAFVLLYPIGAALQPVLSKWALHAGWQMFAFTLMWVGFGLGIVVARRLDLFFNNAHTGLGTVVCALMVVQPVLGFLHHRAFVRHGARKPVSHAHIWFGRLLILLGIVNGLLGLDLSSPPASVVWVYGVAAAGVVAMYMVVVAAAEIRRRQK